MKPPSLFTSSCLLSELPADALQRRLTTCRRLSQAVRRKVWMLSKRHHAACWAQRIG